MEIISVVIFMELIIANMQLLEIRLVRVTRSGWRAIEEFKIRIKKSFGEDAVVK